MANKTINDLTVTTSADVADLIAIWRAANGDTRKITKANLIGATLTGAGTIATGGFTGTLPATGTLALKTGTPVVNNLAQWDTANVLEDSGVATSNLALLTGNQTIAGDKTFSTRIITGRIQGTTVEVANGALGGLSVWTPVTNGFLFVHNVSAGTGAIFLARASLNTVVEMLDTTSQFSHTVGTASSINVYYLGGTGYVVQNLSGSSAFISILGIGVS